MPMNRKDYPPDWKELRRQVLTRANNKCELCGKENYSLSDKGTTVILTVHHIDNQKSRRNLINLIALCNKCHLRLDLEQHIENARKTRLIKAGKDCCRFKSRDRYSSGLRPQVTIGK